MHLQPEERTAKLNLDVASAHRPQSADHRAEQYRAGGYHGTNASSLDTLYHVGKKSFTGASNVLDFSDWTGPGEIAALRGGLVPIISKSGRYRPTAQHGGRALISIQIAGGFDSTYRK